MNRTELIARIAVKHPNLADKDVDLAVNLILGAMVNSLADGRRIEIRGFGSFSVIRRAARSARNPRTGELVGVPEKNVPGFKAGKELKARVMQHKPIRLKRFA